MDAATALSALADPTRRSIFELLNGTPRAVGELAAALPVSRPAVSQHLKVLADAGLVQVHAQGTRRIYRADATGLAALRQWIDAQWEVVMDAFADHARKDAS